MELLQDAANKRQHAIILDFLEKFAFSVLPFNESIGKQAAIDILNGIDKLIMIKL